MAQTRRRRRPGTGPRVGAPRCSRTYCFGYARSFDAAPLNRNLDAELCNHLEHEVDKYVAGGMSRHEAERHARVALGGVDQVKEQCRDARGTRALEDLSQDVRYAVRMLMRSRGFTMAAVTSLALGIGANTAVFTLINATSLRPLPVREPDRLIELLTDFGGGSPGNAFSYQALVHFRDHATTLDAVIASHDSRLFVAMDGTAPEMVAASGSRERRSLSRLLIAGQVALSVTMLVCAGLFLRSLHNLRSIDTGFESDSVLLISTDQSRSGLTPEARRTVLREAVTRISALPGVQGATLADVTPIEGGGTMRTLVVRGADGIARDARNVHLVRVGPNYFSTMKVPVHAGRDSRGATLLAAPKWRSSIKLWRGSTAAATTYSEAQS